MGGLAIQVSTHMSGWATAARLREHARTCTGSITRECEAEARDHEALADEVESEAATHSQEPPEGQLAGAQLAHERSPCPLAQSAPHT